jgi:hypothetical protein
LRCTCNVSNTAAAQPDTLGNAIVARSISCSEYAGEAQRQAAACIRDSCATGHLTPGNFLSIARCHAQHKLTRAHAALVRTCDQRWCGRRTRKLLALSIMASSIELLLLLKSAQSCASSSPSWCWSVVVHLWFATTGLVYTYLDRCCVHDPRPCPSGLEEKLQVANALLLLISCTAPR